MPTPFPLDIVTLGRTVYQGEVERVSLIGGDGSLAIEARHAPLVTNVRVCPVQIRGAGGGEGDFQIAVGAGFLLVAASGASLLVDFAERADEIDVPRAQSAKERAENRLGRADPELDAGRAKAALARALARLRVAEGR